MLDLKTQNEIYDFLNDCNKVSESIKKKLYVSQYKHGVILGYYIERSRDIFRVWSYRTLSFFGEFHIALTYSSELKIENAADLELAINRDLAAEIDVAREEAFRSLEDSSDSELMAIRARLFFGIAHSDSKLAWSSIDNIKLIPKGKYTFDWWLDLLKLVSIYKNDPILANKVVLERADKVEKYFCLTSDCN